MQRPAASREHNSVHLQIRLLNTNRSVLGRVQCLELTGGQGLVKGLPSGEHIGQEYLVHGDHARLQEGHLGLHQVLEDPPGGSYCLLATGLRRSHHHPLLGEFDEHRVDIAG